MHDWTAFVKLINCCGQHPDETPNTGQEDYYPVFHQQEQLLFEFYYQPSSTPDLKCFNIIIYNLQDKQGHIELFSNIL